MLNRHPVRFVTHLMAVLLLGMLVQACGGGNGPTPTFTVSGTVSGLSGDVVLQNNGGSDLTISTNGDFSLGNIANGTSYTLTVLTHPAGQGCRIENGTGTVNGANISNITVTCVDDVDPTGYYTNTGEALVRQADDTTSRTLTELQGMVANNRLLMLSDSVKVAYDVAFTVTGQSFSGTLTVYENDIATQQGIGVTGTIDVGVSMTGVMTGTGVANGNFSLNFAPAEDNGPVTNEMAIYQFDWLAVNPVNYEYAHWDNQPAHIQNFSTVSTTQPFNECALNGRFDPVAGTHIFYFEGTMVICKNKTYEEGGSYSGFASLRGVNPDDRLIFVITNGTYSVGGENTR